MYTDEYVKVDRAPEVGDFLRSKARGHNDWVKEGDIHICTDPNSIDLDVWEVVEIIEKF